MAWSPSPITLRSMGEEGRLILPREAGEGDGLKGGGGGVRAACVDRLAFRAGPQLGSYLLGDGCVFQRPHASRRPLPKATGLEG
jgi:hypothetical protein